MRVDGAHFGQMPQSTDSGGIQTAIQNGSWRGETVSVQKSAASLLADAAEELTFAQAEKEEEKDVSERKVTTPPDLRILQVQEITEYLEAMGQPDHQSKLEELTAKAAASRGAGAGQAAAQAFGDVSQQFLALSALVRHFEGDGGDPEAAAAVRQALEDLHDDHGQAIWAGINSAGAVQAFADGDAGRADTLRECYRETVLGRETLTETFNALLQRFGSDDVRRSIDFLMRAAGDDLSARGPSTPPTELKSILEDLYQLRTLATVLDGCGDLAGAMARDYRIGSIDGGDLMKRLVGLTGERWITSDRFTALATDAGLRDPEPRVVFLQRTRDVVKDLPLKIFPDVDSRNKFVAAAQEAVDIAVEDEE